MGDDDLIIAWHKQYKGPADGDVWAAVRDFIKFITTTPPPHEACEHSRDCIACGNRIEPMFGVCFYCHITEKPIMEAQLPNGRYGIPYREGIDNGN